MTAPESWIVGSRSARVAGRHFQGESAVTGFADYFVLGAGDERNGDTIRASSDQRGAAGVGSTVNPEFGRHPLELSIHRASNRGSESHFIAGSRLNSANLVLPDPSVGFEDHSPPVRNFRQLSWKERLRGNYRLGPPGHRAGEGAPKFRPIARPRRSCRRHRYYRLLGRDGWTHRPKCVQALLQLVAQDGGAHNPEEPQNCDEVMKVCEKLTHGAPLDTRSPGRLLLNPSPINVARMLFGASTRTDHSHAWRTVKLPQSVGSTRRLYDPNGLPEQGWDHSGYAPAFLRELRGAMDPWGSRREYFYPGRHGSPLRRLARSRRCSLWTSSTASATSRSISSGGTVFEDLPETVERPEVFLARWGALSSVEPGNWPHATTVDPVALYKVSNSIGVSIPSAEWRRLRLWKISRYSKSAVASSSRRPR